MKVVLFLMMLLLVGVEGMSLQATVVARREGNEILVEWIAYLLWHFQIMLGISLALYTAGYLADLFQVFGSIAIAIVLRVVAELCKRSGSRPEPLRLSRDSPKPRKANARR